MPVSLHVCMFACKHVLFFVTQIYSLLFCHADFADDADLSCYCGCQLYLPLLPEYYGLYYFVPYFPIKRLFFCKDSHIFRLRSIFVPYFSIKALFLWCFGDYITNHLRHLRHLRDFKSKPRICVNLWNLWDKEQLPRMVTAYPMGRKSNKIAWLHKIKVISLIFQKKNIIFASILCPTDFTDSHRFLAW